WIQYVTFLVVLVLVLAPLVPTFVQSFLSDAIFRDSATFTPSAYARLFTEAGFGQIIWNSVQLAVMTTVIAMVVSVTLAIVMVRIRVPGGRLMGNMLLWPIYIS